MKLLTYLFTLFFVLNAMAVAPYGIKGQSQSGTLYSNVHQFPNNQVTNMGGINALVETGNKNILVNPSFEHSTFSTGWTNSAGTFAEDLVVEVDGLKAAKVTLTAQALTLHQDSTLYQAQFADGVQGLAMVRVKTSVAGIRVCSRQNAVVTSNLCVSVQANGKWGLYKVPFTLGGTSNGISINSNGTSVTGDVYVDDAFLGAVDLKQDVPVASFLGSLRHIGATNCQWSVTSTASYSNYAVDADCTTPTASSPSIKAPTTKIPALVIPAGSPLGNYQIVVKGGFNGSSTGNQCWWRLNDGTNSTSPFGAIDIDTGVSSAPGATLNYNLTSSSSDTTIQFQAQSDASNCDIVNNRTWTELSFELYYIPSTGSSFYSSTNADTDWASCGHTTSDFTGFGTVTNIETQCKRQGSDLLMRGKFTVGTTTATEARLNLKLGGLSLNSANSSKIPSLQVSGHAALSANLAGSLNTLMEPSVGYITFGISATSLAGLTKANGTSITVSGNSVSFNARIPISTFENSNIIIGSFDGIEKCTDTLECTDTFSAKVSAAGVVSDENIDWINGSCTNPSTGIYLCTFRTSYFTVPPNCFANMDVAGSGASQSASAYLTSSSTVTVRTLAGGALGNTPFTLLCQKQGADYIGKTAKAVASDQSIATPGTIKSTLCSAKISSTGVISDQKGGCFASCTNATTPVCTFTSNYWVGGQVPNCWIASDSGGLLSGNTASSTTFSAEIRNPGAPGTAVVGARQYFCHGERQ